VVYHAPARQLARIPQLLREIVSPMERVPFDRAHFKSFGDFALIHEIVYFVNGPDYTLYMDIQQAINLAIFERFQADGIEFAYPTQSLRLQGLSRERGEGARALASGGAESAMEALA
jgi:small-conductance mechanosensitive channel